MPSPHQSTPLGEERSRREPARVVLGYAGLLDGDPFAPAVPFTRRNGSTGRIRAMLICSRRETAAPAEAPLVVQVSRWGNCMEEMEKVTRGFAEHVDPSLGAHLAGVSDDPEGAEVLQECIDAWWGT